MAIVFAGATCQCSGDVPIANVGDSAAEMPIVQPTASASDASDTATASHTGQTETSTDDVALHPTLRDRRYDAAIRDIVVREDPTIDGWDSERFNELAGQQLKKIGHLLSAGAAATSTAEDLCTPDFAGTSLRPQDLKTVFRGPVFTVRRATADDHTVHHRGRDGFVAAIGSQAAAFADTPDSHFKFKVIRVDLRDRMATTKAYFQMTGSSVAGDRRVQVSSTWDCAWTFGTEAPLLRAIRVSSYEEVHSTDRATAAFSDCTQALFAGQPALDKQLVHGRDHWYSNLEATIGVEGRGNGIAIGDVNGDGLEDIYLCQPAALPNRLFIRNPDGTLADTSAVAGVDWLDSSRGALFVDIDNDGDQDLLLAQSTNLMLHENDGQGVFRIREVIPSTSRLFSLNAVDYDNDGDLDLFVCGYSGAAQTRPEDIFASPVPYHDANNGAPNSLFRNDGNWDFVDVTAEVGLDANNLRFSLASAWDDFDNDGDQDLYVANDFGRNNLYRNDAGIEPDLRRFVDVAALSGVEDIGPGMSAAWGDANNDGWMDLYVSNMFSSAGSRITHNPQFKRGASAEDITGFQRHARGNSLFINQGDGTFADHAIQSATTMGRWAWGSLFVDLNNDGWRDLYVANGFVTADNNNDL